MTRNGMRFADVAYPLKQATPDAASTLLLPDPEVLSVRGTVNA